MILPLYWRQRKPAAAGAFLFVKTFFCVIKYPKEAGAVDTIFSPLAIAIGALIGGLAIGPLGFPLIFIIFGGVIVLTGIAGRGFVKTGKIR
jgi:hypothetical protein